MQALTQPSQALCFFSTDCATWWYLSRVLGIEVRTTTPLASFTDNSCMALEAYPKQDLPGMYSAGVINVDPDIDTGDLSHLLSNSVVSCSMNLAVA
jgi:hypothetical protein